MSVEKVIIILKSVSANVSRAEVYHSLKEYMDPTVPAQNWPRCLVCNGVYTFWDASRFCLCDYDHAFDKDVIGYQGKWGDDDDGNEQPKKKQKEM